MSVKGLYLFLIILALGLLVMVWNIPISSPQLTAAPSKPSQIPGLGLSPEADITALDFAVDEDETLHVVWVVQAHRSIITKQKVFYVRGENGGTSWSQPVQLAEESVQTVRIIAVRGDIHIIFGSKLQHVFSSDSGLSWNTLPSLITESNGYAHLFDVLLIKRNLVVVYTSRRGAPREVHSRADIHVVRWSLDDASQRRAILSLPEGTVESLHITSEGERVHVVAAMNIGRQIQKQNYTEYQSTAGLYYARSDDSETWSSPVNVFAEAESSNNVPRHIEGTVTLLLLRGEMFVFYHASALYMVHSTNGEQWMTPVKVAQFEPSSLSASYSSRSVSAAVIGNQARLVWIDSRFRNTDRRWWKPLGGWPWSDQPDWVNNDVFTLQFPDSFKQNVPPERLTTPLSYADIVKIRTSPQHFFVAWSGRSKVGKDINTFKEPPHLFFTKVIPSIVP